MKIEIIFEKPREITSSGLDGTVFLFPFAVRKIGTGASIDEITHHSVTVSISGTLRSMWGFERFDNGDTGLVKVLFEYARNHIVSLVQDNNLSSKENIDLRTDTAPKKNPYSPEKILDPTGAKISIEIEDESPFEKVLTESFNDDYASEVPDEIQSSLRRFKEDHPNPNKTAFIMMQFSSTSMHGEILTIIRKVLEEYGITALRADDKEYHEDMYSNIVTYMYGCAFGIAVFEQFETVEFNPNVSLEIGYMQGLRKPVCLLKDSTLKSLHSDLVSKLYKEFDSKRLNKSVPSVLSKWLEDWGLVRKPEEPPVPYRYSCEYFGNKEQIDAFSKEALEFGGARPAVSRLYEDNTSDIKFSYEGVYPRELFDQIAEKYGLTSGLRPE